MTRQSVTLCAWVTALGLGSVMAQDPKGSGTSSGRGAVAPAPPPAGGGSGADLAAIRAVTESFLKAYHAKDAGALGALFTDGAEVEDEDGEVTRGRQAIVERFARLFAENAAGKLEVHAEATRFLTPDAAIEEGTTTTSGADGGATETSRYSVLYVKQGGRWLQARVHDRPAPETDVHARLKDLEWMIGDWVNESDEAVVSTTCSWSDSGSFLVRQFDVKIEGRVSLSGSQRIGWDPLRGQFRTWVFDTEGGFAEGLMSRDGDRWVVKVTGVRSDGKPVSATNVITALGKDRIGWQTADRTVGGVALPGVDRFVTVRKPPQPAKVTHPR